MLGSPADNVFTEDTTTKAIFDTVAKRIIGSVVEGFNGTIFAYGQTAAGKTYTMQGTKREPGLVRLAAREIFSRISKVSLPHCMHWGWYSGLNVAPLPDPRAVLLDPRVLPGNLQ